MSDPTDLVSPFTIKLITPVDGVSEVTLREPVADEVAKVNDETAKFGAVRAMKHLIAAMSKVEVATVGKMGIRDFNACNKYLTAFFD
ncbi:phage tail assembly protein [Paraburkholderia sp. 35.1]|uniref:phage tail assembly protein n=1 Tax=Paraburkholderia sp. 35.1 TaxID=2991058 RepID=UPI003D21939A